jgi:hypothetical protein
MKRLILRTMMLLLVACCSIWPVASYAGAPQCANIPVGAGQLMVTTAAVTGKAADHLVLLGHHPADNDIFRLKIPSDGYVLTGDKVDVVANCDGYDFVRFHGAKRVSVGWVDASRIKPTGSLHVPLPTNAAELCKAAADTLNRGEDLQRMQTTEMPASAVAALNLDTSLNSSPPSFARMTINGRSLAATSIDSGGSCHSSEVTVLSGDLKSRLSPTDRDQRDIENDGGGDNWGFGLNEDLVVVLGQPMVLGHTVSSNEFSLSVITKDGDIVPTCSGGPVPLNKRQLISGSDENVCHAILDGRQTPIVLKAPTRAQSLSLAKLPQDFEATSELDDNKSRMVLSLRDDAHASEVEYTLKATGKTDIDNSGRLRSIGMVSFFDGNSTAGCGAFSDTQFFLVYLDDQGRADPSDAINKKLVDGLPHGMDDGKLVDFAGKTYIELIPNNSSLSSEVWAVRQTSLKQMCSFKLTQFVVRPVTADH